MVTVKLNLCVATVIPYVAASEDDFNSTITPVC